MSIETKNDWMYYLDETQGGAAKVRHPDGVEEWLGFEAVKYTASYTDHGAGRTQATGYNLMVALELPHGGYATVKLESLDVLEVVQRWRRAMGNRPTTEQLKHPNQPIGWSDDGMKRFKQNAIVRHMVDTYPGGLTALAVQWMHSHTEDYTQLMQLIGYSVSGFGELSSSPEHRGCCRHDCGAAGGGEQT